MYIKLDLTDSAPSQPSVLGRWMAAPPSAGVYNNGLFTICAEPGLKVPKAWSFVPFGDCGIIYAYTNTGNFFLSSNKGDHAYIAVAQSLLVVDTHRSVPTNYSCWNQDEQSVESYFSIERFDKINKRLGNLTYGQCYILAPLLILGGEDQPERYSVGNFEVYIEILSQTLLNNPLAVPEII